MDGAKTLGKTQKNALLDDALCELLDLVQRLTGATFAGVTTASFLKYLFGGWVPPHDWSPKPEDPIWMLLAVDLERGDCTIDAIPLRLLDRCSEIADQALSGFNPKEEFTSTQEARRQRWLSFKNHLKAVRRDWTKLVADTGSESAAIRRMIEKGGFTPIDAISRPGF